MKKTLWGLLAVGLCAYSSHAQSVIAVQSAGTGLETSGAFISLAFPHNTTAGNTIIVAVDAGVPVTQVRDALGNNYVRDLGPVGDRSYIFHASNIAAGPDTVTAVFSASNRGSSIHIVEYSGLVASSPFDGGSGANGHNTAVNCTSVTTHNPNDLLVAYARVKFALQSTDSNYAATDTAFENWMGERRVGGPGTYTASFTQQPGGTFECLLAAYKIASAGGGGSPLRIATTTVPNGTVNTSYTTTLLANGGTPPYTWSVASGSLPPGLALASATGTIFGPPNSTGPFHFTVRVTDASSPRQTDTQALTINVTTGSSSLLITTGALPDGTVQLPYAAVLAATGGATPYRWSTVSGSLPPGLTLSNGGQIAGTPSTTGTFSFTAKVMDSGSSAQSAQTSLSITVSSSSGGATPADPNASPKTRSVLSYLGGLTSQSSKRVISGQTFRFSDFAMNWEDIYQTTGHYPGMMGGRYIGFDSPAGVINPKLIEHWNKGGLVTVDPHPHNPKTGGHWSDANFTVADMESCLTPATAINAAFMSEMDELAGGLQQLQSAGVVALVRPMSEMNAPWDWYGQGTPSQYIRLWRMMFNYLVTTKNLHNLLFVYTPMEGTGQYADFYPGDQYVDVVGVDYYPDVQGPIAKAGGYDELTALAPSKPFCLGEFGPLDGNASVFSQRDYDQVILGIRQNMPRVVYWVSWIGVFTMGVDSGMRHLNVKKLLDDPWVANLGDIRLP